ncbi:Multidrug resistance protein Stp [Methylobacterium crusticola]|uniref:Multidrug resistance protein Stp n=1 Tax=Methylobacterium crusticola TaxID=1697972 RepID=A0ABQ4QWY2_9HYPH|nr:MFS transporter [Methylobacterium crusticola]GJD49773.1 Multidrug resistance protein Stp [Methylobacterium crusticola]
MIVRQLAAPSPGPNPGAREAGLPKARTDAATRPVRPNQVLAIVCVGIVLANLDLFIVNVALPDIGRDFVDAGLEGLSWILNGYAIVYAALLVFFGRLAERYRRDVSFLVGVALFTAASAACAAATSVEMLVAFRVIQAAGAALMTPTSLGLLLATFPPDQRGHAVRTWTAIGGFAAALGPVVGGFLVAWSWRWIFLVNVPIGMVALAVGLWKLPRIPGHAIRRPDAWGAILITLGVGALTYGIMKTADWGWASGRTAFAIGAAALLLALFVVDCLRAKNPFIDPSLFRIRPFTGAALILAPYSVAFGAMLLSIALWLQDGWGWSGLKAGLAIAPGPFLVPVTSLLLAGRLIARIGPASVVALGTGLFSAGMVWWAVVPGLEPSMPVAITGMVFLGVGVGLTFPTLMGAGTAALPASSLATGSGILNMIRQTALALGVALFVAVLGAPETPLGKLAAYERAWWLTAGLTLLSLVPLALLRRPRPAGNP